MQQTNTTHALTNAESETGEPTQQAGEKYVGKRMHGYVASLLKATLFAVLLWLSAQAGAIYIPGTPVPITLQTFVLMLAGLTLAWYEAGSAVMLYLAAGAAGLPVFAAGGSTMALMGPSAGFLFGFLPGVIITTVLRGSARLRKSGAEAKGRRFAQCGALAARYAMASFIGCVVVVYVCGIALQSAITGVPLATVAMASMGFLPGDIIKAIVAACAIGTYDGLTQQR